jgi:glycosyltransferase involved in cell wall biosynthesis
MRIVTVLTSLGMGGAEKQALAVAERMAGRGHAVAVLVLRPRMPEEWPSRLPTLHLDLRKSPLSFFAGLLRASRFLHGFKPDVVHSHSFHANIFARLLKFAMPSTCVLSNVHNVYEGGRLRMLAYRVTDPLSRRSVAVSQAARDCFVHIKAIPARKCRVLPNGIDTAEFSPNAECRASTRSAMNADAHFVWFTAARLVPAKDFPNLVEAVRRVLQEFPDAELWIAGAPPDAKVIRRKDGKTSFAWLSAMERGMRDHVRWLGLRRDVPALLDAADAFVLSSAWEGMPLALGEAMAMEKPVVATDTGGVRDLVGDAGMLVPARDSEALAGAMLATMRKSREERAQLGHAARQRIEQHFNLDIAVNAWVELYEQLTASS